jgi:hypothetical protein
MNSLFHDQNGNISSKRVAGFVVLMIGLVMAIAAFSMSMVKKVPDFDMAKEVLNTIFLTAGALLGFGVVEVFGKKK